MRRRAPRKRDFKVPDFKDEQSAENVVEKCFDTWEAGATDDEDAWDGDGQYALYGAIHPGLEPRKLLIGLSAVLRQHVRLCKRSDEEIAELLDHCSSRAVEDDPGTDSEDEDDYSVISRSEGTIPKGEDEAGGLNWQQSTIIDAFWSIDEEVAAYVDHRPKETMLLEGRGRDHIRAGRFKLAGVLQICLERNVVPRIEGAARLGDELLQATNLIESAAEFRKREARVKTSIKYRQQKFNLFREENEGFSKAIEVILAGMGPPVTAVINESGVVEVQEQESEAARKRRAARIWRDLLALVGYFDLESHRILDLILDLFVTNVTKHYPFFISLLYATQWGSVKGKEKARAGGDEEMVDADAELGQARWLEEETGNYVCAQIMGFKLKYYTKADVTEETPHDILLTTAILIRSGLIKTSAIYHHIFDKDAMVAAHEAYKKALSEKASASTANALTMAAPLLDEDPKSAAAAKKDEEKKLPPKTPQLIDLIRAFLSLGMLQHATLLLAKWPWILSANSDVAILFCRLLRPIVRPVYAAMVPAAADEDQPISSEGNFQLLSPLKWDPKKGSLQAPPPPRAELALAAPPPPDTINKRFVYFFKDWDKGLPSYTTAEEFLRFVCPLLKLLGYNAYLDIQLLSRLCRITAAGFASQPGMDESGRNPWLDILRGTLLGACALSEPSTALSSEIWNVIKGLPYEGRFKIYGEWKALYMKPELKHCRAGTEKRAKGVLKRVSSDAKAQRVTGRELAKVAHSNPLIFFAVALNQVQSYENMISPLVESARSLTALEFDIFTFALLDALSAERQRMKNDGTNLAHWLKSLATFSGSLYRRYPLLNCAPVLQYIVNQLHENNVSDLIVMRELIRQMSGIEPVANPAAHQIQASTGGEVLRREACIALDSVHGSPARTSYQRNGERLMGMVKSSGMMLPLLILIGQQQDACVHLDTNDDGHVKFLGQLFDTCSEVLFQYVDFLNAFLDASTYSSTMPTVQTMVERLKMPLPIAFHISRPELARRLRKAEAQARSAKEKREKAAAKQAEAEREAAKETEGEAKDQEPSKADAKAAGTAAASGEENADAEMEDADAASSKPAEARTEDVTMENATEAEAKASSEAPTEAQPSAAEQSAAQQPANDEEPWWEETLASIRATAESLLPEWFTSCATPAFFATFWQLSLSDLDVPLQRYKQEKTAIQNAYNKVSQDRQGDHTKRKLAEASSVLEAELKAQQEGVKATDLRLRAEQKSWFAPGKHQEDLAWALLQECIQPRLLLSPVDAVYCGKFIRKMHDVGAANFSALTLYEQVFENIRPTLFMTTEIEARNFSRFLQTVLGDLEAWRKDANRYNKDAVGEGLHGFRTTNQSGATVQLSHNDFLQTYNQWHQTCFDAFATSIDSREYMRFRNTIMVLTGLDGLFPIVGDHGSRLVAKVEAAASEETREDLKILLMGLQATLKRSEKSWLASIKGGKWEPKPKAAPKAAAPTRSARQAESSASPAPSAQKAAAGAAVSNGAPSARSTPQPEPSRVTSIRGVANAKREQDARAASAQQSAQGQDSRDTAAAAARDAALATMRNGRNASSSAKPSSSAASANAGSGSASDRPARREASEEPDEKPKIAQSLEPRDWQPTSNRRGSPPRAPLQVTRDREKRRAGDARDDPRDRSRATDDGNRRTAAIGGQMRSWGSTSDAAAERAPRSPVEPPRLDRGRGHEAPDARRASRQTSPVNAPREANIPTGPAADRRRVDDSVHDSPNSKKRSRQEESARLEPGAAVGHDSSDSKRPRLSQSNRESSSRNGSRADISAGDAGRRLGSTSRDPRDGPSEQPGPRLGRGVNGDPSGKPDSGWAGRASIRNEVDAPSRSSDSGWGTRATAKEGSAAQETQDATSKAWQSVRSRRERESEREPPSEHADDRHRDRDRHRRERDGREPASHRELIGESSAKPRDRERESHRDKDRADWDSDRRERDRGSERPRDRDRDRDRDLQRSNSSRNKEDGGSSSRGSRAGSGRASELQQEGPGTNQSDDAGGNGGGSGSSKRSNRRGGGRNNRERGNRRAGALDD